MALRRKATSSHRASAPLSYAPWQQLPMPSAQPTSHFTPAPHKTARDSTPTPLAPESDRDATGTPPAIVLLDRAGKVIHISPAAHSILAYGSDLPGARRNRTLQERLAQLLGSMRADAASTTLGWVVSGRRRYLCWVYRCPPARHAHRDLAAIICLERPIHVPLLIAAARRTFRLSNRESQILGLALLGLSNKEIAGRLRISANTVRTFVRSLLTKLDVPSRSGLLWRLLETRPMLAPA